MKPIHRRYKGNRPVMAQVWSKGQPYRLVRAVLDGKSVLARYERGVAR